MSRASIRAAPFSKGRYTLFLSIGKLERINHYYLTQEDFKDPHISHETVQKQLKQLYGYMGQRKTVTTKKTNSKEFKNLKEEKKHEIIQNIH